MPVLYVTEFRATLRRSGESFVVTVDEDPDGTGPLPERRKTLLEVEPHHVEAIVLVGDVHITSDATRRCLQDGIPVSWLALGGEPLGRLEPEQPRTADLRLAQYERYRDQASRLALARAFVAAKLESAANVLALAKSNIPGSELLGRGIDQVRDALAKVADAPDAASLLGIEGTGARAYFDALAGAFRRDIRFDGRERRPPPDPANALLSFAYTLLAGWVTGALYGRGFDVAIGFYHEPRSGRPSLAIDLMEELRHGVADRFVLRVCNLGILKPDDFEPDAEREGGVRLTADARRTFFRHWTKFWNEPLRERGSDEPLAVLDVIKRQADRLARDLRGQEVYAPFVFGG